MRSDPSVEPLSATRISAASPSRSMHARAFRMQVCSVSASLRQGMRTVTSGPDAHTVDRDYPMRATIPGFSASRAPDHDWRLFHDDPSGFVVRGSADEPSNPRTLEPSNPLDAVSVAGRVMRGGDARGRVERVHGVLAGGSRLATRAHRTSH